MSNKSSGAKFEREFGSYLSNCGFWVHILQDNRNGQPFDIIAVKNGNAYAIDCKVCEGRRFYLNRMEPNQISAMRLWGECGNTNAVFAVYFQHAKQICLMDCYQLLRIKEQGIKSLDVEQAKELSMRICGYGTDNQQ